MAWALVKPLAAGADETQPVPVDVSTFPAVLGDDKPVPPFAAIKVPAKLTAPVVPVAGVKPVEPALKDVTPPVEAAQDAVDPSDVNT